MRATWYTSLIAGALFGAIASRVEARAGSFALAALLAAFFVTAIVGVIGVPQLREMRVERKKRGLGIFGVMAESSDFSRFYVPTWGRMFAWFCGTVFVLAHSEGIRRMKTPNQSLEPTPTAGTSAAEQPLVPAAVVAHL